MAGASSDIVISKSPEEVGESSARFSGATQVEQASVISSDPHSDVDLQNVKEEEALLPDTANRSLSLRDVKTHLDAAQISRKAAVTEVWKDDTSDPTLPALGRLSTDIGRMGDDPSSQFPSPSSGFVPPVTQEDFRLPDLTTPVNKSSMTNEAEIDRVKTPTLHKDVQRTSSESFSQPIQHADEPSASLSIPIEKKTPLSRTGLHSGSSSLSLLSSSSSSSSFDDGHSQAISARSSPSTVAPQKRRSSASPITGFSASQSEINAIPVKVRDFAYGEIDPRHVGARDITVSSRREDFIPDTASDEEADSNFESQQESGLPIGLYHAAYEFVAESEHELSVQAGEKLRLIGHVEGGWAIVIRLAPGQEDAIIDEDAVPRSDKGLVPEAYLEWLA